jgi:hypothetical protein
MLKRWTQRTLRASHLLPLAVALLPLTVHAAWETVPLLSLRAENDDNLLRDATEQQQASRVVLEGSATLSNFNERGEISVTPRFTSDAYSGGDTSQYESTDLFFDARGRREWRVASGGFRSRYSNQIVLNSEFADTVPGDDIDDDFVDPDTGRLTFFSQDRELFDIQGTLDFRLTEQNVVQFEIDRQDVAYSGVDIFTGRSDFDNTAISAGLRRLVDERNTVSARITVSQFYADRNDNTTDSVAVEGTFTRPLAPTWTLELAAGVQRSEYSFLTLEPNIIRVQNAAATPTFSIGFRKREQITQWNIFVAHRAQPNGNGFLVVRDELRANVVRQLSERLTARFGARLSTTKTLDDVRQRDDRDYNRFEASLEWAVRQTVFMVVGYDRIEQEFTAENAGAANSNMFYVGIRYQGRSRQN